MQMQWDLQRISLWWLYKSLLSISHQLIISNFLVTCKLINRFKALNIRSCFRFCLWFLLCPRSWKIHLKMRLLIFDFWFCDNKFWMYCVMKHFSFIKHNIPTDNSSWWLQISAQELVTLHSIWVTKEYRLQGSWL